jgi:hypothetical protein
MRDAARTPINACFGGFRRAFPAPLLRDNSPGCSPFDCLLSLLPYLGQAILNFSRPGKGAFHSRIQYAKPCHFILATDRSSPAASWCMRNRPCRGSARQIGWVQPGEQLELDLARVVACDREDSCVLRLRAFRALATEDR